MTKTTTNTKKGLIFLLFALLAFAGLGLEMLLAFLIEPIIYGTDLNNFSTNQMITHWIITCAVWAIVANLLIFLSNSRLGFNIFAEKRNIKPINWLLCVLCLAVSITISIIDWKGFKVAKEFAYNGWLKFIFQYIYYIAETILVYLIIAFGQEAGEKFFTKKNIPYGGILSALTWGLIHWLTKGDLIIGLVSLVFALLFGVVYLLAKKNTYIAFPFILLMLIL